jgi:hypothetical protein
LTLRRPKIRRHAGHNFNDRAAHVRIFFSISAALSRRVHHVCITPTFQTEGRNAMSETVIGLFPQSQQGEEVVPMLANRGYGQRDVETLGGRRASLSSNGADLIDKLANLGVAEVAQLETLLEAVHHGGLIIAARTADARNAAQLEELMLEHGATQCLHTPDTGWTPA